jgi:K(+)-stimulated pyrophosphate-energized sodium pump
LKAHKDNTKSNTTKAITKGVAIGSAVIAAVSLFGSYMVDVSNVQAALNASWAKEGLNQVLPLLKDIGIVVSNPVVFVGMLIGAAVPWLFSSFAINAVRRAASLIVEEVRRQFKRGILENKAKPDYGTTVAISTSAAQKELVILALLGIVSPIFVGLSLGVEALGGFLAGIIVSGQLLAVFMSNAGGAWDNAKKYVEEGNFGGKGSEGHKATVVGDTVGDPFKDTSGPSLNILIKLMSMVSIVMAGLTVTYHLL